MKIKHRLLNILNFICGNKKRYYSNSFVWYIKTKDTKDRVYFSTIDSIGFKWDKTRYIDIKNVDEE